MNEERASFGAMILTSNISLKIRRVAAETLLAPTEILPKERGRIRLPLFALRHKLLMLHPQSRRVEGDGGGDVFAGEDVFGVIDSNAR